ncbi:MAG: GMC family oxidoreductase [Defluviimonas sp.]|uniref:FAD-dependent oxidoreductase n=1 Tax=Albidovulum sp. TaxID=1872424 RepID=UPI001D9A49B9|nr:GMC family oxidoreductase [Paracoccaceae bacterium]MCC0064140.1 GMC family oxidoreductase [Defluviimonas sp.]
MIVPLSAAVARRRHDVCIVGSGPAGLSLALELDRAGLDVMVLESGLDGVSEAHQDLAAAERFDPARHDDMRIATARRLGGTSNLWGARCQPMDPIDFAPRPDLREAHWPIAHDEVARHYPRAAELLTCGAPVFESAIAGLDRPSGEFMAHPVERFANEPATQRAHRDRLATAPGITVVTDATVTEARFEGDRLVALGAATRAGARHEIRAGRFVIAAGGLESTRLLLAFQRGKPDLCGGARGPLGRYYMGHLIGEVADIEITAPELDAALDFAIDAHGSYARHRLIPSPALQKARNLPNTAFWPVVPPVWDARHRDGILSMVYLAFAFRPLGQRLVAEAIRKRHVPGGVAAGPHLANVLRGLRRVALYVPRFFWRRYLATPRLPGFFLRNPARRYALAYHAEQSPRAESRVRLGRESDALGLPKLVIELAFARSDAEALTRAHEALDRWLRENGLGRLHFRQSPEETPAAILALAAHGTHQIGTARMGLTPRSGAVDRDLRCFGTENLYLCSSAVFPTSGQCNPTLTIVALACRLAAHLSAGTRAAAPEPDAAVAVAAQ